MSQIWIREVATEPLGSTLPPWAQWFTSGLAAQDHKVSKAQGPLVQLVRKGSKVHKGAQGDTWISGLASQA